MTPKSTRIRKTAQPRAQDDAAAAALPALAAYQRKRDFSKTPEPGVQVVATAAHAPTFVVQQHAARRLHYDFRLEWQGVLWSWAVPKGPSLDPDDKRLAVHVEDHPLAYGDFEGIIPKGEYGGGTVQLWDRGTWQPAADPELAMRRGHLRFSLDGAKLQGAWDLIRMSRGGTEGEDASGKEQWLLRKVRDEFARTSPDITQERPESVATGRQLHEIAQSPDRVWSGTAGESPPDFVPPQLARPVQVAPEGEAWLHEVKLDGYRAICRIEHGAGSTDVRIRTRSGQDWSARFGAIATDLKALPCHDAVLDGEIVALRDDGVSDFQKLANLIGRRATDKVAQNPALHLFTFDLLWLDGKEMRGLPLSQRKDALQALLRGAGPHVRFCDHVIGKGPEFFTAACRMGLEGILAKRADAPYTSGRGSAWLKVKCLERQEFVVVGWTDPEGNRSAFGALLLGVHRPDGRLHFAGRVGTGFTEASLKEVASEIADLGTEKPPVVDPPSGQEAKGVHWLRPKLVCEVQFAEWTDDDRLRQPSFRGLRRDRAPDEVTDERLRDAVAPQAIGRRGASRGQTTRARLRKTVTVEAVPAVPLPVPAGKDTVLLEGVRLTHPNKVLFPEQGVTKLVLAQYHARVADRLLPYVADRPLTLVRCPEGPAKGPCFFQKHVNESMPAHIFAVTVQESAGPARFITIRDRLGLLALVQIGAVELHPWGARNDALDKPDVLVFDLDPDPGLGWPRLVEAALLVQAHLRRFDLESFVRTTGGKGLHVVVPVVQQLDWTETKRFCGLLAEAVVRSAPERYTATMAKAKRTGKVFVDWFRNGEGATSVASWSPRARLNAPIAVPISWDELPMVGRGDRWHVSDIEERLALADPWAEFHTLRQQIARTALAELGG